MFWIDRGMKPKIERAYLDGSDRQVILNDTDKLSQPTGLAIDYETDKLYFCDTSLDKLWKMDLNGRNLQVLVNNLTDCSSVTVFDDYVYWADISAEGGSIWRANKVDGSGPVMRKSKLGGKKMDLKVYDKKKQIGNAGQEKFLTVSTLTRHCTPAT